MLVLSEDSDRAREQMMGLVAYLVAFGHIDGEFTDVERGFVRQYCEQVIAHRVHIDLRHQSPEVVDAKMAPHRRWLEGVLDHVEKEVRRILHSSVAHGVSQATFVREQLLIRCVAVFQRFDARGQAELLETLDELRLVDDFSHPAEVQFRQQLVQLLRDGQALTNPALELGDVPNVTLLEPTSRVVRLADEPLLSPGERAYPAQGAELDAALRRDHRLVDRALLALSDLRAQGAHGLQGAQQVHWLGGREPFLDGFVQVIPAMTGRAYDLTVVSDLHGSYSCLKAAVIQSGFRDKLTAWRRAPDVHPEPWLIFLGDYINRGAFGFDGVLRGVLTLFCDSPDRVVVLRGNHDTLSLRGEAVEAGMRPAGSIDGLASRVSGRMLEPFARLFDSLPTAVLFDQTLITHGGLPREQSIQARYRDLTDLNDALIRREMVWSEPSPADVIPVALQSGSRFNYGRLQAQAFLQRLGCQTIIRGHQRGSSGSVATYDDGRILVVSLSSGGGADNLDYPEGSAYRAVEPMALSLEGGDGVYQARTWPIDYGSYNHSKMNGFYR